MKVSNVKLRGDTLSPAIAAHIADVAKAKEREACARLCEERKDLKIATTYDWTRQVGQDLAAAIRARSNVQIEARPAFGASLSNAGLGTGDGE